jgi:DNA-binding PadR family transcriptional regulator
MPKWLQSGRRRDVCVILYDAGELNAQSIKSRLESRYGDRIEPKSFYGALDAMVETGHLETRTDGIHDVYALTDAGREMVETQFGWMREHLTDDPDDG